MDAEGQGAGAAVHRAISAGALTADLAAPGMSITTRRRFRRGVAELLAARFETCAQVRNEVRVIFDAHRDPEQRSAYSRPQSGRFIHAGVRHARR